MAASSPGFVLGLKFWILLLTIMSTSYFNVTITKAGSLVCKRIVCAENEENVGHLVEKCLIHYKMNSSSEHVRVERVMAAESSSGEASEVELKTPLSVLISFNLKCVTVHVRDIDAPETTSSVTGPGLYEKLMKPPKYDKLPKKYPTEPEKKLRGDFVLFNDLIDMLERKQIGFTSYNVTTVGTKVTKTIHNVLWYITTHHSKLKDRAAPIPGLFEAFRDYYDHRLSHKAPPQLKEEVLRRHVSSLSELLMLPWTSKFKILYDAIEGLTNSLKKYADFLSQQSKRSKTRHSSLEPLRNPNMNFSLVHIEPVTGSEVKPEYTVLNNVLCELSPYDPIEIGQFSPDDRFARRSWMKDLVLSVPISHYTYYQGNYLGNTHFIWRIPGQDERTEEMTLKVVQTIHSSLPKFVTRQIKHEFIERYQQVTKTPKALLRNIHRFLTDDSSAAETGDEAAIDSRVEELLTLDDEAIAWDLRCMNGNANATQFDVFWTGVDTYFNEINLAVQERRHGSYLYLPYAISIEDLISQVRSRLPPDTPIPSNEWVRLQFWPRNPNTKLSLWYTGRFHVKFAMQSRQIRGTHEDCHFVASQLIYLKKFAVKYRDNLDFFWLDDKAIVPIGEPGLPVGTGVRPHNASLVPKTGPTLSALDHDYNVCGAIPSVAFKSDVPCDASDSFFNGVAFVTVKDKVFSPSNAIRHGCEMVNILKSHYAGEEQMDSENPILILYTDGGPDHRTTFGSVHVACLAMFMWLDLDMLVTARTAPMGSWANLAERVNSVLNLALQNVSLEREPMTDELEFRMKRVLSLKTARDTANRFDAFKDVHTNNQNK